MTQRVALGNQLCDYCKFLNAWWKSLCIRSFVWGMYALRTCAWATVDYNNKRNLISLIFLKLNTHISSNIQRQVVSVFPSLPISADHILAAPAEVSSVGDAVGRRDETAFTVQLRAYERLIMQSETLFPSKNFPVWMTIRIKYGSKEYLFVDCMHN